MYGGEAYSIPYIIPLTSIWNAEAGSSFFNQQRLGKVASGLGYG